MVAVWQQTAVGEAGLAVVVEAEIVQPLVDFAVAADFVVVAVAAVVTVSNIGIRHTNVEVFAHNCVEQHY